MALETLKGVTQINGEKILQERPTKPDGSVDWEKFDELRKEQPIFVDHNVNMISFRIQNGPIGEVGKNGCQVTELVAVAKHMIAELNKKFPCTENYETVAALEAALMWQKRRTENREKRGVEGKSKV